MRFFLHELIDVHSYAKQCAFTRLLARSAQGNPSNATIRGLLPDKKTPALFGGCKAAANRLNGMLPPMQVLFAESLPAPGD